jgi:uncharacterized protein
VIPAVVREYVAQQSARRDHLVVYLSGAHAYGFPSPDSDFDLKCVHVAPTRDLVGLTVRDGAADGIETIDGVEIDYGSNEIGPVLRGVLRGNGNYLERLLGALVVAEAAPMQGLRPLVRRSLSQQVHRHYAGFGQSQLRAALEQEPPAAKKVLYVLRTTLTGAHLLRTGALITDLGELADPYGFGDARELIAAKKSGERVALAADTWARWRGALDRAFEVLDAAQRESTLPAEPPDDASTALETWLVDLRRDRFDAGPE